MAVADDLALQETHEDLQFKRTSKEAITLTLNPMQGR